MDTSGLLGLESVRYDRSADPAPIVNLSVFISHSSHDISFANQLSDDLRKQHVDTWLDSTPMRAGNFFDRIKQALMRDVLLLVLTPSALTSHWVQSEMHDAIARHNQGLMRGPLIVVAQSCPVGDIPDMWVAYHRYDAMDEGKYAMALQSILRDLKQASS
jgi:hypothetical protein